MSNTAKSINIPVELLAPAKNAEVGRVAIDAGADAVYIGGPSFGARKAAGNSIDDIAQLCRYAHLFGAKVLVTLNTLLHSNEYSEAVRLAYEYRRIGVDAIIIQDLQLADILFRTGDFSGTDGGIRLHASTQCDNRDAQRVLQLQNMGFKRVVLARELSYNEIHEIRQQTTCELEAFVHGALCVSYSGACYLSEDICGRSANRGECAQMCRMKYDVLDAHMQIIHHPTLGPLSGKHILSLKDLDRSASLQQLLDTGVTTLKIEGRLKDADYVRNVVAYYRMLLDRLFADEQRSGAAIQHCPASAGTCQRTFIPNPEKTFHRGSTEYFALFNGQSSSRPDTLINIHTPKSTGEYLGNAPLSPQVIASLHNGDGLTFAGEGFYWPNSRIRIPAGTPVFRNLDVDFQRQLTAKDATTRTLPVTIRFSETSDGFAIAIAAADTPQQATVLSIPADKTPAQNADRALSVVRQQLAKLGGTGLDAADITVEWSAPYFLPAATLNDWRRQAVELFLGQRTAVDRLPASDAHIAEAMRQATETPSNPTARIPEQLMTCRYCLLYELGCCKQQKASFPTPAYLRQDNILLEIHTNCHLCQMTLTRKQ